MGDSTISIRAAGILIKPTAVVKSGQLPWQNQANCRGKLDTSCSQRLLWLRRSQARRRFRY